MTHLIYRQVATCLSLLVLSACSEPVETRAPAELVQDWYLEQIDTLIVRMDALSALSMATPLDSAGLQQGFADARLAYKRIEHLTEYFSPALAETVNGPPIAEIADDEPSQIVIPAEGFQVLEELLFPTVDSTPLARQEEIAILRANLVRLRSYAEATELSDGNLLEAIRFQLARVLALGLSGFDSPVAHNSLPEAAASLAGLRETLHFYSATTSDSASSELEATLSRLEAASAELLSTTETFDTFDRLAFLTDHLMPLHRAVTEFRDASGITPPPLATAWRASVPTPYDAEAFDPSFFSPTPGKAASPELVALGRELFHEPALSGSGTRSCASCHDPEKAFTDGLVRSPTVDGEGETLRNAPTLLNAALQFGNFYDLRTTWLEDQIADVLASPGEMASSAEAAARRVAELPRYEAGFRTAFVDGDSIRGLHVQKALATYIRSLSSLDSRFDRYVRGDKSALDASEIRGFNAFMGKAGCGTCHFAPLFSGAVPPVYSDIDLEVIGVPARPDTIGAVIDADEGRYPVYRNPLHRFAFRTSTVRNVEFSAPYMHNGVFATLEDVVDFYDRGGGAGIGIELENQTLPAEPLELTSLEKADLVAFMRSLTDAAHR